MAKVTIEIDTKDLLLVLTDGYRDIYSPHLGLVEKLGNGSRALEVLLPLLSPLVAHEGCSIRILDNGPKGTHPILETPEAIKWRKHTEEKSAEWKAIRDADRLEAERNRVALTGLLCDRLGGLKPTDSVVAYILRSVLMEGQEAMLEPLGIKPEDWKGTTQ